MHQWNRFTLVVCIETMLISIPRTHNKLEVSSYSTVIYIKYNCCDKLHLNPHRIDQFLLPRRPWLQERDYLHFFWQKRIVWQWCATHSYLLLQLSNIGCSRHPHCPQRTPRHGRVSNQRDFIAWLSCIFISVAGESYRKSHKTSRSPNELSHNEVCCGP